MKVKNSITPFGKRKVIEGFQGIGQAKPASNLLMTLYKIVHRQEGHETLYWKRSQDPAMGDKGEFVAESEGAPTPFDSNIGAEIEIFDYVANTYGYENVKVEPY